MVRFQEIATILALTKATKRSIFSFIDKHSHRQHTTPHELLGEPVCKACGSFRHDRFITRQPNLGMACLVTSNLPSAKHYFVQKSLNGRIKFRWFLRIHRMTRLRKYL